LWPTLAALADELMSILKIVVTRERFRHVVARVERSAVQSFDETNLILIDHGRIEETDVEQTRLGFAGSFERS
jgi:hypothetical protein